MCPGGNGVPDEYTKERLLVVGRWTIHCDAGDDKTVQYYPPPLKQGGKEFQYKRFGIRARILTESGSWPAIWTLGKDMEWPSNGEQDSYWADKFHIWRSVISLPLRDRLREGIPTEISRLSNTH